MNRRLKCTRLVQRKPWIDASNVRDSQGSARIGGMTHCVFNVHRHTRGLQGWLARDKRWLSSDRLSLDMRGPCQESPSVGDVYVFLFFCSVCERCSKLVKEAFSVIRFFRLLARCRPPPKNQPHMFARPLKCCTRAKNLIKHHNRRQILNSSQPQLMTPFDVELWRSFLWKHAFIQAKSLFLDRTFKYTNWKRSYFKPRATTLFTF